MGWDFARNMLGFAERFENLTISGAAVAKGDPLIPDGAGAFKKASAATDKVMFVAQAPAAVGEKCPAIPALSANLFRVPIAKGTPLPGLSYDLDPTTLGIDGTAQTAKVVTVVELARDNPTGFAYVSSRGWL